jgi:steroid delta-isomerase-like uncharacterized protein
MFRRSPPGATGSWRKEEVVNPQVVGVAGPGMLADTEKVTTTEDNKAIVSDFIDALFTRGDLKAVDVYLADDFVNTDPPFGATVDREGMRAAGAMFRSVFPDWHSDVALLVAEDDIVVELFTASGTHTGAELMGAKPSGERVSLPGINIWRIRDARIVERWGRLDDLGFLRQLGVIDHP